MNQQTNIAASTASDLVQGIARALFGEAGAGITDLITLANCVQGGTQCLAEPGEQQGVQQAILHALADAYSAGAVGLKFGGLARRDALLSTLAATGKQQVGEQSAGQPEMCRLGTEVQAKQVGEVQGDALVASLVQIMNAEYDGLGRLPADVLGVLNIAAEALAARQPGAQVPVAWQVHRTDGSPLACWEYCTEKEFKKTQESGRYMGLENGPLCKVRALYAAPPAQGIDLGQADMFWLAVDGERMGYSVEELIDDLQDGEEIEIQAAVQLPNFWVRVKAGDGGSVDFDVIDQRDAAPGVANA